MQQGFGAARGPKAGPFRAERTKPVAEAPGNRRNHPAATRIAGSYGESRLSIDPTYLAAIAAQESGNVTIDDGSASRLGDRGHGHGLLQIDDRSWPAFTGLSVWSNSTANAFFGAGILARDVAICGTLSSGIQAYNTGSCHGTSWPTTWLNSSDTLQYNDSVSRHQQRITDYKAVCPNGNRA
jgi:hypothetical protein